MSDNAGSYPPQYPDPQYADPQPQYADPQPQYADPQPQSTTDVAREQAANVGQSVSDAGSHVTQTATDQARQVAAETARQARDLMGEATGQVRDQASAQQQRAASQLRSVADELHEMVAKGGQSGLATEVAQQAAERLGGAASWLERREPADLLASVRDFARRRPGTFLAGAAIAGLAAGRLTRGITAAARSGSEPGQPEGTRGQLPPGGTPDLAEPTWTAGDPAYQSEGTLGRGLTAADTPASGYQSTAYRTTGYQDPAYQGGIGQDTIGETDAGLPADGVPYPEGGAYAEGGTYPAEDGATGEDIAVPPVPGYVAGDYPDNGDARTGESEPRRP